MVSPDYEKSYSDRELNFDSFKELIENINLEHTKNPRVKSIVINKLQEALLWYWEFNNSNF